MDKIKQKNFNSHNIKLGDMRPIIKNKVNYCTICGKHGKSLYTEMCG